MHLVYITIVFNSPGYYRGPKRNLYNGYVELFFWGVNPKGGGGGTPLYNNNNKITIIRMNLCSATSIQFSNALYNKITQWETGYSY